MHPFLFSVPPVEIRLDWEHTEYEWVEPEEIGRRPTVAKLVEVYRSATEGSGAPATFPPQRR